MLSGFADAIGVSGKLGIIVAKNPKGEIVIERLVPGGPAAKDASLKAGDVLLQIDGKAVASDTDAVADQLLGAQGSEAVIKAKQNGLLGSSIKEVKLKRSQASDPNQGSPADPKRSSTSSSKAKEPASPSSLFGFISPQGSAQEVSPGQKPKKEADGGWNLFGDVGAALGLQTAGIGVKLGQKGSKVFIAELMPGGQAAKSGKVSQGDTLVAVDGTAVDGSPLDAVMWRLTGAKGSELNLKLLRSGLFGDETVEVTLVRCESVNAVNAAEEEKKRAEAKKRAEGGGGKKGADGGWNLFSMAGSVASGLGLPTAGVGVMLEQKGRSVLVSQVIRGGAADKSGRVAKGDIVKEVDGDSADGCSAEWVGLRLAGPRDSEVKVKLERAGLMGAENIYVTLKRTDAPAAGQAEAEERAESERKQAEQKRSEKAEAERERAEEARKRAEAERKAKGGDAWSLFSMVGDAASAVGLPTSGVGLVLRQQGRQVMVAEVVKGGPADKSGRVYKGDQVAAVEDESMEGCSAEWAGVRLSGPKGSDVKVKLVRTGMSGAENIYVTLKRDDPPAAAAEAAQKRAESERKQAEQKRADKAEAERKARGEGEWSLFSMVGDAASAVGLPTCGVGVKLADGNKEVVVAEVLRGGVADKSGRVNKGDVLKEVDGQQVESAESGAWKLAGPKGSEVKLKLVRSGLMGFENVYVNLKRHDDPAPPPKKAAPKSPEEKKKAGGKEGGHGWDVLRGAVHGHIFNLAGGAASALGLAAASGGVGIRLGKKEKSIVIGDLMPGGPAAKSGKVEKGDELIEVDGEKVEGGDMEAVGAKLTGAADTEVKLKLRRGGFFGFETLEVLLRRVETPTPQAAAADAQKKEVKK